MSGIYTLEDIESAGDALAALADEMEADASSLDAEYEHIIATAMLGAMWKILGPQISQEQKDVLFAEHPCLPSLFLEI